MNRFKVIEESVSAHCCFCASIIDTHKPKRKRDDKNEELEPDDYEIVCECFDLSSANLICEALNK